MQWFGYRWWKTKTLQNYKHILTSTILWEAHISSYQWTFCTSQGFRCSLSTTFHSYPPPYTSERKKILTHEKHSTHERNRLKTNQYDLASYILYLFIIGIYHKTSLLIYHFSPTQYTSLLLIFFSLHIIT